MLRAAICAGVVGILYAGASVPLSAHHSFAAEFDNLNPVTVRGTITKVEWVNPHGWLWVDVKNEEGKVVNWGFELGSPFALLRAGWKRDDIKPGTVVEVSGYRARNGLPTASGSIVKLPDGRDLFSPGGDPK